MARMITRQAKRRVERAARKHIAAIDADLIARIRSEKRGWIPTEIYHGFREDVIGHLKTRADTPEGSK